jgi:hypothetical protein
MISSHTYDRCQPRTLIVEAERDWIARRRSQQLALELEPGEDARVAELGERQALREALIISPVDRRAGRKRDEGGGRTEAWRKEREAHVGERRARCPFSLDLDHAPKRLLPAYEALHARAYSSI